MEATAGDVDYETIKGRQRSVWGSGDYASIAARIMPLAEKLCDDAGLRAGQRVLDVACGSGNAALAAARRGCRLTGLDYAPSLLERARARAAAEGVEVEWVEGDAEALPFPDGSFDAVLSVVGVMFAPDQERAARELVRVCRPGGTIALISWSPDGFIGELFKLVGGYLPPPPGVRPPVLWGDPRRIGQLLDGVASLEGERHTFPMPGLSPAELADLFLGRYGPTLKAWEAQDEGGREAMRRDLVDLIERYDDDVADSTAAASDYLEVIARR